MIDITQPESNKILKACSIIDELLETALKITTFEGQELQKLYQVNKHKLAMLALLADETLTKSQRIQANKNVMLLYKLLTGQVAVTANDLPKINDLLEQLSNECFCCWCI